MKALMKEDLLLKNFMCFVSNMEEHNDLSLTEKDEDIRGDFCHGSFNIYKQ
jgi:hypothetical protein